MAQPDFKFPADGENYSTNLNELLKKIISLDKEGRAITAHAEDARAEAQAHVAEQVKLLRTQYMERTKNRLSVIEQDEHSRAETELEKEREKSEQSKARLESIFAENKDKWAQEIFDRTVKE